MYFWNYHALVDDLRRGNLTERQKLIYFLVYFSIFIINGSFVEAGDMALKIFGIVVAIAIQVITAVVCYRANSRGDGRNFLERYICLQVPMTIRFWVFGIVIGALFVIVFGGLLLHMPGPVFTVIFFLLIIGAYWVYISYLRAAIARVAALPDDEDISAGPTIGS